MKGLLGARRLRELFDKHSVRPTKALGQNFVVDPNTIRKVLSIAALSPSDRVLEIGAGAGSLTLGLASTAAHVTALEFDARLIPVLTEALDGIGNVDVVRADALDADLGRLDVDAVVANLPYNIAVPVVMRVLEEAPSITAVTVMTQREVGERLAASPGTKAYGQVSVLVGYFARARVMSPVSRRAFWPVPNVDSVIVRLDRHDDAPSVDRALLFEVVKASFAQRRKMLRNNLAALAGGAEAAEAAMEQAGIDPRARAEEIALDGYVRLAERL
jgi:16S rRNA (adenine1518-N6/adenine1519-N6)-dimethyltransferase